MPTKLHRRTVTAVVCAAAVLACTSACCAPSPYLPLAAGNSWYYTHWEKLDAPPPAPYALSFPGSRSWTDLFYYYQSVAQVTGTADVNGVSTFLWDHGNGWEYALAPASNGILCYQTNGSILAAPQFLLKLPPTNGAYWDFSNSSGAAIRITTESVADTVEVPAGRFANCLRAKLNYYAGQGPLSLIRAAAVLSTNHDLVWFAPSIGIVREEYYKNGVLSGWATLDAFSLNYTDSTPPPTPVVIDDGAVSYGNSLHARWVCDDAESGVAAVTVILSRTPDESGIVMNGLWDNVGARTEFTTPGLELNEAHTYYFLVKVRNNAGLWSGFGVSDGIQVRLTPPNSDLFPLNVGNYWSYDCYWDAFGDWNGYAWVTGSTLVSGVTQFDVETFTDPFKPLVSTFGRSTVGLFRYKLDGTALSPSQMFLKQSPAVGDTWQWSEASGITNCSVVSTNEVVSVPSGVFAGCVVVRSTRSSAPDRYELTCYAPGIGVVKTSQIKIVGGKILEQSELSGWHVFPGPPDTTAPSKPVITLAGSVFYGANVQASWKSTDAESGVCAYQAAVSTSTTESGIVAGASWRSFGSATSGVMGSLPLQSGVTYYLLVRAMNAAGLWSPVGASAGFKVEKAIGSITIQPGVATLAAKAAQQFTATVRDTDGLPILGKTLTWSCSTGAGTITSAGKLTAGTKVGLYAVSVTLAGSGISDTADVTIVPGPASKVLIIPTSATLACAEQQQFFAAVADSYNNPIPGAPIVWSIGSSYLKSGEIDPVTGLFTAGPNPGSYSAAVVATSGLRKATAKVVVTAPPPVAVKLFLGGQEVIGRALVAAGSKAAFTAKGYDALMRPITGLKFTYAVQGAIGTISTTSGSLTAGRVAGSVGTVAARAVLSGIPAGAVGAAEVEIVPAAPSRAVVVPPTVTLAKGLTQQYDAQVFDAYNNLVPGAAVKWIMAKSAAGTITPTGLFTAGTTAGTYTGAVKAATVVGSKVAYGTVIVVAN